MILSSAEIADRKDELDGEKTRKPAFQIVFSRSACVNSTRASGTVKDLLVLSYARSIWLAFRIGEARGTRCCPCLESRG